MFDHLNLTKGICRDVDHEPLAYTKFIQTDALNLYLHHPFSINTPKGHLSERALFRLQFTFGIGRFWLP